MWKRYYTYLIGCSVTICILIVLLAHRIPPPQGHSTPACTAPTSPISQALSSSTHVPPTSPFSQALSASTHVPPTSPFSQALSYKTLSSSASLLNSSSLRTINEIMSKFTAECVNKGGAMDPFFVHFIKTDPVFQFYEYVAVRSAVKFIKPDVVFIVTRGEVKRNCWWKRTLALPLVKHVMIPAGSDLWVKKIRGKFVAARAHVCDFMKQMLLYELGGISMDTDSIAVRSFDDLKNNQVTIAWDHNGPGYFVNGLMVSQRHSCFMCRYTQLGYQKFDGLWASSGIQPLRSIVEKELTNFKDVGILGQYNGFFPFPPYVPGWTDFALKNKEDLKVNTTEFYAIHLFHGTFTVKGMPAMKAKTIDKYSWLNTSKSYAGELFRSVLPKHFTEEHFNTAAVCCPLIEDPNDLD